MERSRTRGGSKRVGGTKHRAASFHCVKPLPDHCDNGAGGHVLDESREERLVAEIGVVYVSSHDQE
jgi:hypothetical protein